MTNDKEPRWTKIGITQSIDDLLHYGPTIDLEVSGLTSSPRFKALAQIDTGADVTCISVRIARKLALEPISTATANQPGMAASDMSCFGVLLTHPLFNVELIVAALDTLELPHDVLIGRDLLKGGRLTVDFTTGLTALHIRHS